MINSINTMVLLKYLTNEKIYQRGWGIHDAFPIQKDPNIFSRNNERGSKHITDEMIENRKQFIKDYFISRHNFFRQAPKKLCHYFYHLDFENCRREYYHSDIYNHVVLLTPEKLDDELYDKLIECDFKPYKKMFGNFDDTISFVKTSSKIQYDIFRTKQKERKKELIRLQKENKKRYDKGEITFEEYDDLDMKYIREKFNECNY